MILDSGEPRRVNAAPPIKVLVVNPYDSLGGAARSAYRIHRSLVDHGTPAGVKSIMQVYEKGTNDTTVRLSQARRWDRFSERLRLQIAEFRNQGFHTANPVLHSTALRSGGWGEELNATDADVLHLNWVGQWQAHVPTLSIEEIGSLRKPVVWTLHDQWAFCGAEHYVMPPPDLDNRYISGYTRRNRPLHEIGPDLNRRTWQRKRRAWRRKYHIVCPSYWMADCVRRSALMGQWPVRVIPYPIDLATFKPSDQAAARAQLGLPQKAPLLLFSAFGGTSDPRKGFDLLAAALASLSQEPVIPSLAELQLVVLGEGPGCDFKRLGFPTHSVGHIDSDEKLRLFYTAVDAVVVPSRLDNLPNIAIEAHACGTSVVAFKTGGLEDIVVPGTTGALAEPFDPRSLGQAILWILEKSERPRLLGKQARYRAESLWEPSRIAALYAEVYQEAISQTCSD